PGIFGIVDLSQPLGDQARRELRTSVERMAAAMRCEPAYRLELIANDVIGACIGRVTLPVRDTSTTAAESNVGASHCGVTVITTDATGDGADDLLVQYQQQGEDCLKSISSSCAGCIVDEPRAMCLLFNDRYGVERLFLHRDGSRTF